MYQRSESPDVRDINSLRNRFETEGSFPDPPIKYKSPVATDLYSLAAMFEIDPEVLWKMNSTHFGIKSTNEIPAGTILDLPADAQCVPGEDIITIDSQNTETNATSERETATVPGYQNAPPHADTSRNEALENLKSGKYSAEPVLEYATAKRLLIEDATQSSLSPEDKQFLIGIITRPNEETVQTKTEDEIPAPVPQSDKTLSQTLEDIKLDKYGPGSAAEYDAAEQLLRKIEIPGGFSVSAADKQFLIEIVTSFVPNNKKPYKVATPEMIEEAVLKIVQTDGRVKNAYLFLSRINQKIKDPAEQEKELMTFFTGTNERNPVASIVTDLEFQGLTDKDAIQKQEIKLSGNLSYPMSVYVLMHEMNHYMNAWYHSKEARKEHVHRGDKEASAGIRQRNEADDEPNGIYRDLDKEEQQAAMSEGTNATIDMIMKQVVQRVEPPYPHPRAVALRADYQTWLRAPIMFGGGMLRTEDEKTIKQNEIKKQLLEKAADTYGAWGMEVDYDNLKLGDSYALEMGFTFEKQAYEFYDADQKNDDWAVDSFGKFEEQYKSTIDWYE